MTKNFPLERLIFCLCQTRRMLPNTIKPTPNILLKVSNSLKIKVPPINAQKLPNWTRIETIDTSSSCRPRINDKSVKAYKTESNISTITIWGVKRYFIVSKGKSNRRAKPPNKVVIKVKVFESPLSLRNNLIASP